MAQFSHVPLLVATILITLLFFPNTNCTGLLIMTPTPLISDQKNFILDFDGTITTKDTIETVINIGISFHKTKGRDLTKVAEELVEQYSRDYSSFVADYRPSKEERNTLEQVVEFQRCLKDIEVKSFDRVSRSGIFEGMDEKVWEEAGRNAVRTGDVVVRDGFKELVWLIRASKSRWGIVSVNFSGSFIKGVLEQSLGVEGVDGVPILANSPDIKGILRGPVLEEKGNGVAGVMATSDAKLIAMKHLMNAWELPNSSSVVYFGDSTTDIECLTHDDVMGIVISDNGESSLMKSLENLGKHPDHIENVEDGQERRLYWAQNFEEFRQNLLRSQ